MTLRITNIQHFSLHDGPGIRTTVFLKGCNLKCPWCANPECISSEIQGDFGYDISLDKLENEIIKDKPFYETGGGVTFSGGEPLLQINNLEPLLNSLKNKNINICFETALFVPEKNLKIAKKYSDEIIVDIKMINPITCKEVIGGKINQFLNNLELLDLEKTTFRIPVTKFSLKDTEVILDLLKNYKPKHLEIFKLHNLAKSKYDILNKEQYYEKINDNQINEFHEKLKEIIPNAEIIEI